MVTCQVAHSVFGVPRKIARLRAQAYLTAIYSDLYRRDHMPIDVVISPEYAVAEAVMQPPVGAGRLRHESFLDGQVQLLGISLDEDCAVLNTPLRQLSDLFSTLRAVVIGVRRGPPLRARTRGPALRGRPGLRRGPADDANRTHGDLRQDREAAGAHRSSSAAATSASHVARALEARTAGVRAKIIERDRAAAELAADALERTVVLNGDGLDDRPPRRGRRRTRRRRARPDRRRQGQHPRLRPRQDRGREDGGRPRQRPLADQR